MRWKALFAVALACTHGLGAQAAKSVTPAKDAGVQVPGWVGRLDPAAERSGAKLSDAKFFPAGDDIHVAPGPPAIFWHPSNKGIGAYSVAARFTQTKAPDRAEYYGLFIGGSRLDRPEQNYLYCVISGNGTFTVKHRNAGEVNELVGRTVNAAIRKANADGQATNEVAFRVTAARTSCLINGTEVWGYASKDLVGPGKLVSTDGVAGIRVNHHLDIRIAGFALGK